MYGTPWIKEMLQGPLFLCLLYLQYNFPVRCCEKGEARETVCMHGLLWCMKIKLNMCLGDIYGMYLLVYCTYSLMRKYLPALRSFKNLEREKF